MPRVHCNLLIAAVAAAAVLLTATSSALAAPAAAVTHNNNNNNESIVNALWKGDDDAAVKMNSAALHQQLPLATTEADRDQMIREGFRLIATSETERQWMAEDEILRLIRQNKKFMDVTDGDLEGDDSLTVPRQFDPPKAPKFQSVVKPYIGNISEASLSKWLTQLTSFKTRYYQSTSGKDAALWIKRQVEDVAESRPDTEGVIVTTEIFEHSWTQPSVIARIEKAGTPKDKEIVVIGAHLDSVNQWNPWFGVSPGADDDGSGSVTIFEAYRILVQSGFVPSRPIEFHWYAAEEGGLLGSQKVVAKYKSDGIAVAGVYHADMTGYTPDDKPAIVGVSTDHVNDALSDFLRQIVDTYCDIPWGNTKCGYACSDHASWTKAGYASAFTFEADFDDHSPYIHTTQDDVSHVSFGHIAQFSRVAIGFAIEVSLAA